MSEAVDENLSSWVSNKQHIRRNVVCVVNSLPVINEKLGEVIKTIFELHSRRITGLCTGLVLYTDEAGVKKYKPYDQNVVVEVGEKYGKPIMGALSLFVQQQDPNTFSEGTDFELMFFESDPTHTVVVDAWICKNAYIVRTGSMEAFRDVTAPPQIQDSCYEIKIAGEWSWNTEEAFTKAQTFLSGCNTNPHRQPEA